jgi:integrase
LYIELTGDIHALRAKRAQHLTTVLSKSDVNQILNRMQGLHQLMAQLLYGCGLRYMECLRLRVKDIAFAQSQIVMRSPLDSVG